MFYWDIVSIVTACNKKLQGNICDLSFTHTCLSVSMYSSYNSVTNFKNILKCQANLLGDEISGIKWENMSEDLYNAKLENDGACDSLNHNKMFSYIYKEM